MGIDPEVDEPANQWTGPLARPAVEAKGEAARPDEDARQPSKSADDEAEHEDDEDEGPEEQELDWPDGPFEKDLDADGTPEKINWFCEPPQRVRVNQAVFKENGSYADLMGCTVSSVDLDPEVPGLQLLFIGDEHEEAGSDRHVLLEYKNGTLTEIWSAYADVSFYVDGSWASEDGDCNEFELVYTTTTETHRWVNGKVETKREVSTHPIDAEDCAEP